MGQKVHPTGFRVGITEEWRSRWYATKQDFGKFLVQDHKIREHIKKNYGFAAIPEVEIERRGENIRVIVQTARPGVLIGKKGAKVDKLRDDLRDLAGSADLELKIKEISKMELNAQLVAESVAEQLQRRQSFRRTLKRSIQTTMQVPGALGCKIHIGGRLGGAEMARQEKQRQGRIPLSTLRAHISYGLAEAHTTYGTIGVKCWIYLGEYPMAKRRGTATDGADAKAG
ncbi:MAG: 30S ribosomal protein S3 [Planctomycetes bacterium]|nr:30S ribosomal protein S3 [Planctomycetota bacterium]